MFTLKGLQTFSSNKNNGSKIHTKFRFRWNYIVSLSNLQILYKLLISIEIYLTSWKENILQYWLMIHKLRMIKFRFHAIGPTRSKKFYWDWKWSVVFNTSIKTNYWPSLLNSNCLMIFTLRLLFHLVGKV